MGSCMVTPISEERAASCSKHEPWKVRANNDSSKTVFVVKREAGGKRRVFRLRPRKYSRKLSDSGSLSSKSTATAASSTSVSSPCQFTMPTPSPNCPLAPSLESPPSFFGDQNNSATVCLQEQEQETMQNSLPDATDVVAVDRLLNHMKNLTLEEEVVKNKHDLVLAEDSAVDTNDDTLQSVLPISNLKQQKENRLPENEIFLQKLKRVRKHCSWNEIPMDFFVDEHVTVVSQNPMRQKKRTVTRANTSPPVRMDKKSNSKSKTTPTNRPTSVQQRAVLAEIA